MRAEETIRFFEEIGYVCRPCKEQGRNGWILAPNGTGCDSMCFPSLSELRREWRWMLRQADMVEDALAAAIQICRGNAQDCADMRAWAESEGIIEIHDDLDYPMRIPYMKGNADKRFSRKLIERLAPHAWRATEVGIFPRLLEWFVEEDHRRLCEATPLACKHDRGKARL